MRLFIINKSFNPFVATAAISLALSACTPPKPAAPPTPKVTISHPQTATVTNWDEYPGHLEAVETVEVRPRVNGYIDSIHFQEGAEVKVGDLLVVIDPRPYQAELEHAEAQRLQAETHLEWSRSDLKRADGLRGTKAISDEEYDSRRNSVREAEAALAAAKAAETTARINIEYTQIKSPIDGRIGRRLVTVGNVVQGGGSMPGTVLATIVSLGRIYCYFDVQEDAYLRYRRYGAAGGPISCEVALVNETGFPHQGHIDFLDNQVDPKTGTIRTRGVFDNQDRGLIPGLFANVRVPAGPPVPTLLIPDVAIGSDQGRKFVYVVNQDSIIKTRPVKTDRAHGAMRSVLSGLTPEDQVVVNGLLMLRPEMKVDAQEAKPAPASPEATPASSPQRTTKAEANQGSDKPVARAEK